MKCIALGGATNILLAMYLPKDNSGTPDRRERHNS